MNPLAKLFGEGEVVSFILDDLPLLFSCGWLDRLYSGKRSFYFLLSAKTFTELPCTAGGFLL